MNAIESALRRAVATDLQCAAECWIQNRRDGDEFEPWITCERSPGHSGPHDDGTLDDGWGPSARWNDDSTETFDSGIGHGPIACRPVPSPWTAEELAALNAAAGSLPVREDAPK